MASLEVELEQEGVQCAIPDENGAVDEEEASSMASCSSTSSILLPLSNFMCAYNEKQT